MVTATVTEVCLLAKAVETEMERSVLSRVGVDGRSHGMRCARWMLMNVALGPHLDSTGHAHERPTKGVKKQSTMRESVPLASRPSHLW